MLLDGVVGRGLEVIHWNILLRNVRKQKMESRCRMFKILKHLRKEGIRNVLLKSLSRRWE